MEFFKDLASVRAAVLAEGMASCGPRPFASSPFGQNQYMSYLNALSQSHPNPMVRRWAKGRLEATALAMGGAIVRFDPTTGLVNARGSNRAIVAAERRLLANPSTSMSARVAISRDLFARGGIG